MKFSFFYFWKREEVVQKSKLTAIEAFKILSTEAIMMDIKIKLNCTNK